MENSTKNHIGILFFMEFNEYFGNDVNNRSHATGYSYLETFSKIIFTIHSSLICVTAKHLFPASFTEEPIE